MTGTLRFMLIFALLLVAFLPITAVAEFRQWENSALSDYDGLPLRQGYHIEWFRSSSTDSEGNMCVVWSDTRLGDRDIWAQLIGPDGTHLWEEGGVLVVQEYSRQEDPNVTSDNNGNWVITWVDYRDDILVEEKGDIYAQKLNGDGERQWQDSGVPLRVVEEPQLWVQGFPDGNGGVVTIWVGGPDGQANLFGQRIDADGNILWDENGIVLAGGDGNQGTLGGSDYTADTDDAGGMVYGWRDFTNPSDPNIRMNRVDGSGNLLWGTDFTGVPVCMNTSLQSRVRLAPDGEGGAFLVWEDSRNIDESGIDLYGQHVDADGNFSWTVDGVPVAQFADLQTGPRIVNSGVGEAVFIWEDFRSNPEFTDLYTQRISDDDGSPMFHWGPEGEELGGMLLANGELNQTDARLTGDGLGGAVYAWIDERNGASPNNDLYAQHVSAAGERLWGEDDNGIVVCDAFNQQNGSLVRVLDENNIAIIWFDYRKGSPGLYFQRFDFTGLELQPHNGEEIVYGIDADATRPRIIDGGDDHVLLAWSDGRFTNLGTYAFAQKIDRAEGTPIWGQNGVSMTPGFPYSEADTMSVLFEGLAFARDGQGGLIGVWSDTRFGSNPFLFAQRLNSDGEPMWGDRGTTVAYAEGITTRDQGQAQILPLDDGGAFIAFIEFAASFKQRIKIQRLNANGEPQYFDGENPGIFLTTDEVDDFIQSLNRFDDGSILLVYRPSDFFSGIDDLYAMRLSVDGELLWDEPVPICTEPGLQYNAVTTQVDGGIVIAWEDQRRGSPIWDIYAQIIHPDGSIAWAENGAVISAEENEQTNVTVASSSPDATDFWISYRDASDGEKNDIILSYYDLDANLEHSARIGLNDHSQSHPTLQLDHDGGVFIAWEEEDRATYPDLMFSHLNADGQLYHPDYFGEGEVLTSAYHRQSDINMTSDNDEGFIAVWSDARSTGKEPLVNLYMQRISDFEGAVGEQSGTQPSSWSLSPAYPNPFNPSTTIRYNVAHTSTIKLGVYDVLGREVTRLVDGPISAGQHAVQWNGMSSSHTPVSSGTYFIRLEAKDLTLTRRVVLMK
ncbi:T9SS type A sorting domain-containing protein [bacterium]|nr:T9SS type A sorting domain-containing protein [bacterium]